MPKTNLFTKIKDKINQLMLNLSALSLAYKRKDVPILAKITIVIAVGYALSPIDLIPDFIPVLGYLDDLIIVPLFIFISIKLIPKEIMDECLEQARDLWKDGKPKKWFYAVPIVIVWFLIIFIIAKNIFFRD